MVSKITLEMQLLEKWAEHNRIEIAVKMEFEKRKSEIELQTIQRQSEVELFQKKLTPEFLRYTTITVYVKVR